MFAKKRHEPETNEEQLAEGTLISHLLELRSRLVKCVVAVLGIFVCLVPFANDIFSWISEPLRAHLPEDSTMIATQVTSPFLTPFKTSLFVALFLAMPVILYQVWQFVAPGLYRREKRFAFPLLGSSILLFYAGVAFAYYVVFDILFAFFAASTPPDVAMMTDISEYLTTVLTLSFAFGVAFEVPIATLLLIWSGLIEVQSLRSARPYVFLGAFVVGMFLTPPDILSQTLLAVPMYLLYESGLFLARFLLPEKMTVAEEAET